MGVWFIGIINAIHKANTILLVHMKLVCYIPNELPHPKNWEAIQRMCVSYSIEFEYTNSIQRIQQLNYDILYCMMNFVDPHLIPEPIKIFYGPQLFVLPVPPMVGPLQDSLKSRCVLNTLSKWVTDLYYETANELIMPLAEFPFAVNTDVFQPKEIPLPKEFDCLVYIKLRSKKITEQVIQMLNNKSLKYKILTYGKYNEDIYKYLLYRSKFMLVIDRHESQGFGLQEAMSCNIPLLVMDVTSMYDEMDDSGVHSIYEHLHPKKLLATSVPYWSHECGIKITEIQELSTAIDTMLNIYTEFKPRDYIVRTLSDKVCMKRILDYFGMSVK